MKVGDKVYTPVGYVGTIIKYESTRRFPYLVKFDNRKGQGYFDLTGLGLIKEDGT
jgi:hypothetical protein